jgi:hypothetical protein
MELMIRYRIIASIIRFIAEPLMYQYLARCPFSAAPLLLKLDDRRGQKGQAECFTPATQPVLTDDLDQQSSP